MSEWVDLEAKNIRAANALLRQKLEKRDNPGVWNQWVKGHLSLEDWVIEPQPPEAYRLPSVASDFVSPPLIAELRDIFAGMREVISGGSNSGWG